jgi:hypothetical protein
MLMLRRRSERQMDRVVAAVLLVFTCCVMRPAHACIVAPTGAAMAPSVAAAELVAHGVAANARLDDQNNIRWIRVDLDRVSRGSAAHHIEAVSPCGIPIPAGTRVVVLGHRDRLTVFSANALRGAEVPGLAPAR